MATPAGLGDGPPNEREKEVAVLSKKFLDSRQDLRGGIQEHHNWKIIMVGVVSCS